LKEEVMMSNGKSDPASEDFKTERTYIENLLAARINFFLVFASFYLVAVFGSDKIAATHRAIALILGGMVSLVMALSVLRTTALVEQVLRSFRDKHPDHPYSLAHNVLETRWWVKFSANTYISLLPWGITLAFFWLAFSAWRAV
jgi:cytochrome c biogenesis protein CcdA